MITGACIREGYNCSSSSSDSVTKSEGSSAQQVLHMTLISLLFSSSYSNWYVGVSHWRQIRYSGSLMRHKNTVLGVGGADGRGDESRLAGGVLDDRPVDVCIRGTCLHHHAEIIAFGDQRKEDLNRGVRERIRRKRKARHGDVPPGDSLQGEGKRGICLAEIDQADIGAEHIAERQAVQCS